jgi:hypothetical protein
MRSSHRLAAAVVTSLALATPALTVSATAAPDGSNKSAAVATVDKKKPSIKLKRAAKGVQPGIGKQKITAIVNGGGKVKFTLSGEGIKKNKKVKVKKGKAVFKVPPLGTGTYKVKGTYNGKKDKIKFEVYDSALTLNSTSFTVSASDPYTGNVPLTGTVRFKGKPASEGYVDLYKDGKHNGGASSPHLLGFGTVQPDGSFTYQYFGPAVANKYGVGTWSFQAYYTDSPSYADYVSSNFIVVTVVP